MFYTMSHKSKICGILKIVDFQYIGEANFSELRAIDMVSEFRDISERKRAFAFHPNLACHAKCRPKRQQIHRKSKTSRIKDSRVAQKISKMFYIFGIPKNQRFLIKSRQFSELPKMQAFSIVSTDFAVESEPLLLFD